MVVAVWGEGPRPAGLPGGEGESLRGELQGGDALATGSATKQRPQEGTAAASISSGVPCPASSLAPLSSSLWSTGSQLWPHPNPLSRLIRL